MIGRFRGTETGVCSGLLLWGVGNLLVSALMARYVYIDTVVVLAAVSRCEPGVDSHGQPTRQFYFGLRRAGEPAHEVQLSPDTGLCPETPEPPIELRVRKDALAAPAPVVRGTTEPSDLPATVMVGWGAFGGMTMLLGLLIIGARALGRTGLAARGGDRPRSQDTAPWRPRLGILFSQLGGLLFLAAFVAPGFIDGSESRALQVGFRWVSASMGCFVLASWVAGKATWPTSLFLLMFGGMFLGAAELARA